jgi:hypothetical protein
MQTGLSFCRLSLLGNGNTSGEWVYNNQYQNEYQKTRHSFEERFGKWFNPSRRVILGATMEILNDVGLVALILVQVGRRRFVLLKC